MALRVLVVEDQPDLARVLRLVLEPSGHEIVTARSVEEARRALHGDVPPALVLVDLALGDGDGLDLCRLVQGRWPTRPILVCTPRASPELHARAVLAGASAFLARPFEPDALVSVVERLLNRARSRAS